MPIRNRRAYSSALRRTIAALDLALCKLHHIEFDAPWKEQRRPGC